jgi:uncharacterized delta-60 repeat protein
MAPSAGALQAGALDPSYATGGVFTRDLGAGNADGFSALALAGDGSVFAAGGAWDASVSHTTPIVAKFTPGGVLDASFGTGGIARLATPVSAYATAIRLQTDGLPVIAGSYGSQDLFIGRLLVNGAPDPSYGSSLGYITRSWPQEADVAAVVQTPLDGSVVVGTSGIGDLANFTYQRFDSSGANYSGSYKSAGAVGRGLGDAGDPAQAAAGTGDGGFYAAGTATITGQERLFVYRIDGEGYPVTSFGGDGSPTVAAGDRTLGFGVALQPDGRVLASGDLATGPTTFQQVVVRLLANGALDPSFGSGGVVKIPPVGNERNYGLALQPDGKILAVGSANDDKQFSIVRLNVDGSLDPLFGLAGHALVGLGSAGASAVAAVVQATGRIVAAGGTASADTQEAADSALVGLLGNGQPPTSAITSPSKSKLARKKLKKIAGTAGPAGDIAKVEIAIRRIDAKQLKRKRCLWIKNSKGAVKKVTDKKRKCTAQVWLKASGTTKWSYKLKRRLPKGSYRIYSRTTLSNGVVQTSFSSKAKSLRTLQLTS